MHNLSSVRLGGLAADQCLSLSGLPFAPFTKFAMAARMSRIPYSPFTHQPLPQTQDAWMKSTLCATRPLLRFQQQRLCLLDISHDLAEFDLQRE